MRLELNECTYLKNKIGDISPLSLFNNVEASLKGDESESLNQKNIFKDNMLISEMIKTVAVPDKSSRMILNDGQYIVEKYTYGKGNERVVVSNQNGTLLIEALEKESDLSKEVAEFLGISVLKYVDIDMTLSYDETLVFLTLLDLYRQNELLKIAGFDATPHAITYDKLKKALDVPFGTSIMAVIKQQYQMQNLSEDQINIAIEGLIKNKCLIGNEGLALAEPFQVFAKTFLIPELTLLLEQYELNEDGDLIVTSGFMISTGMRSHLSFIFLENQIEISTLSGLQSLQMIENFMKL